MQGEENTGPEKFARETYSMPVFGDGKNFQFLVQSFTPGRSEGEEEEEEG